MKITSICLTILMATSASFAQTSTLSNEVMTQQLAKSDNFVYSNASLDGLLSLLSFGYRQNEQDSLVNYWDGQSLADKAKAVQGLSVKADGLRVSVNNQVWLNNEFSFLPQYTKSLQEYFGITPQTMDVSNPDKVVDEVNQWASDNTNELITDILKPEMVNADTVTILANAVYFKGEWAAKFDKADTTDQAFRGADLVPMMSKEYANVKSHYDHKEKVMMVELPYKGETHSMVIAMPSTMTDLGKWQGLYESDAIGNVKEVYKKYIVEGFAFSNLKNAYPATFVTFKMPKFEIESDIQDIQELLPAVGLGSLTDTGVLSNMVEDPRARLSFILQKAKIIVNEEGSEAAAVSVGGVFLESISMEYSLHLNGPFAYAIRDNVNDVTLFEGILTNPKK